MSEATENLIFDFVVKNDARPSYIRRRWRIYRFEKVTLLMRLLFICLLT